MRLLRIRVHFGFEEKINRRRYTHAGHAAVAILRDRVSPFAPASRLPQAEAAGPSSLLRNGQDHAATSAQLLGLRQPARPNPKHRFVRLSYYFGDVSNGVSAHLALGDFIRPIAAGTVFIV